MLLIAIFIVSLISFFLYFLKRSDWDFDIDMIMVGGVMSLILHLFVFLIITLVLKGIWFNEHNVLFSKNIEPITSLKYNNNGIGGQFFLGSGSVDNKRYYYFMKKNEDGSFSESRVTAPDTKIFEDIDSIGQPYVMRSLHYKVLPPFRCFYIKPDGNMSLDRDGCGCGKSKVEIHVPKGTIIQEYQIKL